MLENSQSTQIAREPFELLQLQYELAMAIGASLEMQAMLREALGMFLRKLNCSSASVFVRRHGQYSMIPECSMPRGSYEHTDFRPVAERLVRHANLTDGVSLSEQLPCRGGDADSGHYHVMELPQVGFIVLVRQDKPLDPLVEKSILPLLKKLATACLACLQNEELKDFHQQLEHEHSMLRTVVTNIPIIIFSLDREGIFTLSEGRSLRELGRDAGEIVGLSIFDYYADTPEILDAVRAALNGQSVVQTVEVRGLYFEAYYEPTMDANGLVNGVVGVAHDITERKASEETLETVLNTVGEGILTIDSKGTIVMVNQEAVAIFGYARDELLGLNLQMLMPEQYRTAHQKGIERYLATNEAHVLGRRLELEGLHKDQHVFPLEIRIRGGILREQHFFTASVRDITHRKQYARMRDDFVSAVSHELRTPLAAILGWTETLLSGRPGPLTVDQERFLRIIETSSGRLRRLIEEILTASSVQSGTLKLELAPFLPGKVINDVRDMFTSIAEQRSVILEIEDSWPETDKVIGDASRIEQVLTNLVGNALKFSPSGSIIRIQSRETGSFWHLAVHDQGIGIPDSEIVHLFERFYRASTAKEASTQGTGLGLYISKAIVEAHGGTIDLTSTVGSGTVAWFRIPKA